MATSVLCSLGVHLLFLQFLYHIFGQSIQLSIAKRLCLWEEAKIKASKNSTLNLEDVKLIAGLDTSTCKHFDGSLAVVSCTVCSYSDLLLDVVYSKDELCLLQYDYFPDFLSLRELKPLERILRKLARDYSIDLLLIDANGTFHQRGFSFQHYYY
jgi:deoxyinosine 3'endonuclease (endonuclease V)